MNRFISYIKNGDIEMVRNLIDLKPELANCIARQSSQKDEGQSALQIAIKTGNFEIANYLIDNGADINYIEFPSSCQDDWCMPVLHISVMMAVRYCRHNSQFKAGGRIFHSEHSSIEEADAAYELLKRLLELGSNIKAVDSFGCSVGLRLCKSAEEILPQYDWNEMKPLTTAIVTPDWIEDLTRIFIILRKYGADFSERMIQRFLSAQNHPLQQFLKTIE